MKENRVPEVFAQVVKLLKDATSTSIFMDFRKRYASPEQWKVEGPGMEKAAYLCWFAAKTLIGNFRPELEVYVRANKDNINTESVSTFMAAIQVIDKELERVFEQDILTSKEPQGYWEGDEYLAVSDQNIEFDTDSY